MSSSSNAECGAFARGQADAMQPASQQRRRVASRSRSAAQSPPSSEKCGSCACDVPSSTEQSLLRETVTKMNAHPLTCSWSQGRRLLLLLALAVLLLMGAALLRRLSSSSPSSTTMTASLWSWLSDVNASSQPATGVREAEAATSLPEGAVEHADQSSRGTAAEEHQSASSVLPSATSASTPTSTPMDSSMLTSSTTTAAPPEASAATRATTATSSLSPKGSPTFRPPSLPSPWAQGGGSVRVSRAFSVLTVAPHPPLTTAAADAATLPPHHSPPSPLSPPPLLPLLRRAARRLALSGTTQHPAFYEWLVVHNTVFAGGAHTSTIAQQEEEALVREWWSAVLDGTTHDALPRVRVEGLPHYTSTNPHATKRAFALLYGMRLVLTEYVLLQDLQHVPKAFVLSRVLSNSGASAAAATVAADAPQRQEAMRASVQRELTLALQALSQNAFHDLPYVLASQGGGATAEEAVHAFRLQVYITADQHDAVQEAQLQAQLVTFVKNVLDSVATGPKAAADTDGQPSVKKRVLSLASTQQSAHTAAANVEEVAELPATVYGTNAHFHCQRAPLYAVRVPVPAWLRASRHHSSPSSTPPASATASSHEKAAALSRANPIATPPPPALSTLCEVLLSRHSGMPAAYTADSGGDVFHNEFCQAWLRFTLLPSPFAAASHTETTEPPTQNLLAGVGEVVAGAARRRGGNGGGNNPANSPHGAEDDVRTQHAAMAQSLGDGLCSVEWTAHLKAAQLWYAEQAERHGRTGGRGVPAAPPRGTAEHANASSSTNSAAVTNNNKYAKNNNIGSGTSTTKRSKPVLANAAGPSPYLDQYAALLFSDDAAQLARLAGTYLAYLPNASHALRYMRATMTDKLNGISLKYAVERTRRHKSQKMATDREVVCLPSQLSRADLETTMYNTQWFLTHLVFRCLQHPEECLGGLTEVDARVTHNMDRFFSATGKWSRGEFRVCMSGGALVSDPFTQQA